MAFNRSGSKVKRMSYTFATIFSGEKVGNEYQMVKVGMYDEKLTFNFYKGTTGSANKMVEAFVRLDYESTVALSGLFEQIVRSRVQAFREQSQYLDNVAVDYNISFTDAESKQLRTIGHFIVKTKDVNGRYVICIQYSDGKENFEICLCSTYIQSQISFGDVFAPDIDLYDGRLYAFCQLLSNIVHCWPMMVQMDTIARIQMNRLTAMGGKLGLDYSGNGRNNKVNNDGDGNYNDKSYRSGGNREVEESVPEGPSSDEPF